MTNDALGNSMSPQHYYVLSRWLHWLIAGLIFFMIFLGWGITPSNPNVLAVAFWHKSAGILVLLLSLARIAVRLNHKAPPQPVMPAWQAVSAKTLHVLFYVAMIGMPLTGWAMVSTSPRDIPFFIVNWFHLPVPHTEAMHDLFEALHDAGGKLLAYLMIPLHVGAALKHHLVNRDNVMEGMLPGLHPKPILNWRWIIPVCVIVAAVVASLFAGATGNKPSAEQTLAEPADVPHVASQAPAASLDSGTAESHSTSNESNPVPHWKLEKAGTALGWTTSFQGEDVKGGFERFTADIVFDAERLQASRVTVRIDLTSLHSGDSDSDLMLRGSQFFATEQFPQAIFYARRFTALGKAHFIAHGNLTLHGTSRPLDLPFTLSIKDGRATVVGETLLDRTAFGVGRGEFAGTDAIPANVNVQIRVNAVTAPAVSL